MKATDEKEVTPTSGCAVLVTGFPTSDALGFRLHLEPIALMQGITGERSGAPLCLKPASSPCSTVPLLPAAPLISVSAPVTGAHSPGFS